VASKVADILDTRELWIEREFLDEAEQRGLTGRFEHVIGLLRYLQSQGLATRYDVCLPTLTKATRSSYFEHEERVIISESRLEALTKDLQVALKLPGRVGIASLRHAKRRAIRDRVMTLARAATHAEREPDGATFLWSDATASVQWDRARYPASSDDIRALEDIALPELTAALRACSSEDAAGEAARAVGIRRLSAAGRGRLRRAAPATGHIR
jgi:hypothetical protein